MPGTIHGTVASPLERVRDVFVTGFTERAHIGAAVAVIADGEVVVDLWGGEADDRGQPWQRDTLVCVASARKGPVSLCAHLVAEQGELDLTAPVARYWPEFAQAGKGTVSVQELLSHRAGLIAPRQRQPSELSTDWAGTCTLLAETEPWWQPGTAFGYHAVTWGYLAGELIRRITGCTPGEFLARELADPVGADVHIGVPASQLRRCATLLPDRGFAPWITDVFESLPDPIPSLDAHPLAAPAISLRYLAHPHPNSPDFRTAEIPAANMHATALGLARLYAGVIDGTLLQPQTVAALSTPLQPRDEPDVVLAPIAKTPEPRYWWGSGVMVNAGKRMGPNLDAFGHGGVTGALAFADPTAHVAFAYTRTPSTTSHAVSTAGPTTSSRPHTTPSASHRRPKARRGRELQHTPCPSKAPR